MQALPGQKTMLPLQALLSDGALAGDWALDPGRSTIRLKTSILGGLVPVTGVFRDASGSGTVAADGQVRGTVAVRAASIDTGNARRDTHLRSADFLDSDNNPDITLIADGIRPSAEGVAVTGMLTVRDTTRPVSFDAAVSVQEDGEAWLDAEVRINRADFGVSWNLLGLTSMDNTLTVHAVFTRR